MNKNKIIKNFFLRKKRKKKIRPTTSIAKKILFNWLKNRIKNSYCLDCFSGSGGLAIESIKNCAKNVTLLEKNKDAVKDIRKKIKQLKTKKINIIQTNTIKWLNKKGFFYDIVFIDPPFKKAILQKTIFLLEENSWIKKKSIIYIEKLTKNNNIIIPKTWILKKKKKFKKYSIYLYIKKK